MMSLRAAVLFALAVLIAGCGGDSSTGSANIRAINLVRGAASVSANTDAASLGTLTYGQTSPFASVSAFPQTVSVTDPGTQTQVGITTLTPSAGLFYTVVAYGVEGGTPAMAMGILTDTNHQATSTTANVRYGNFSASLNQAVDVYITTSTATISSSTPVFTNVAYGNFSSYASIAGGTYRIRVFATGTTTTPLIDVTSSTLANNANFSLLGCDSSPTAGEVLLLQEPY
jgi:hypothetical protein